MQPTLDLAYWLSLVTSVILPVLVGLVTTKVTSPGTKGVLLLLLSAINGLVLEIADHPSGFNLGSAVILAVVSFGTSVLAHFGFWKPTGVSAMAQALGAKARPAADARSV